MSAAYVIFSSKPDLCVSFYTHVLGLKNKKKRAAAKKKKTKNAAKTQADIKIPTPKTAAASSVGVPFLINHEYIMALPSVDDAPKNAIIEPENAEAATPSEIYFVVKKSLDDVCKRFKQGKFESSNRVLHLEGVSNALRVLHLHDPDGNKLRLVELA